jgi:site-specific DNA-cytosine methylase
MEVRHFHLFCGLGGGARGFNRGQARVGHLVARFRCIGGVDVDAAAVRDFGRLAGVRGTNLDLFDRAQYIDFHGKEPPSGWREATPDDIRAAAGGERPHIVFTSPPCKGFSGLLSETRSTAARYQALNRLTIRGIRLALEAWGDDPPEFFILENVPRIATRGRSLVDEIIDALDARDYAVAETAHDCGELGGLAQTRRRFLLVARHRKKVPPFLYQPPKRRVRGVGEVLGSLPLPGDPRGGPMHRMRLLQWKTWVRLAFVEAGGAWRSLERLRVVDGHLADFAIAPARAYHRGVFGVTRWEDPAGTVTGGGRPGQGCFSVADPREEAWQWEEGRRGLGVVPWDGQTGAVTSQSRAGQGAFSVADPRIDNTGEYGQLGVKRWEDPANAVSGQSLPGGGRYSVADPRLPAIANRHATGLRVTEWNDPAATIIGPHRPGGGDLSVADPRVPEGARYFPGVYGVTPWADHASTVTGESSPNTGRFAVADPRLRGQGPAFNNVFRIVPWGAASPAVTGPGGAAGLSVADPRAPEGWEGKGKYRVTGFEEPAGAVIAASTTGNGAFAVADPRPGLRADADYQTAGHYGVVPWEGSSRAVTGTAGHDNGPFSVADPRAITDGVIAEHALPAADQRLVAVIRTLDGTWHRPFTTLELAALQSIFDVDLDGSSDSAWRERIGNAVPPDAAEAIGSVMGRTLLLAWSGETFVLSSASIWVRRIEVAVAVDVPRIELEIPR